MPLLAPGQRLRAGWGALPALESLPAGSVGLDFSPDKGRCNQELSPWCNDRQWRFRFANPQRQMKFAFCVPAQRRRPARFHSGRPSLIQHVFEAPRLYRRRGLLSRALLAAAAGISATAAGPLTAGAQPSAELLAAGVAAATSTTATAAARGGASARSRAAARGRTAARSRAAASRGSRTGARGRTATRGGGGTAASRRRSTTAGIIRLDAGDQRQTGHDGQRKNETVHR